MRTGSKVSCLVLSGGKLKEPAVISGDSCFGLTDASVVGWTVGLAVGEGADCGCVDGSSDREQATRIMLIIVSIARKGLMIHTLLRILNRLHPVSHSVRLRIESDQKK